MPKLKPGDVALVFREGDTIGEALDVIYDIPEGKTSQDAVPDHFHACAAVYNWIATDPERMAPIMKEYFDALNAFCEKEDANEDSESETEEGGGGARETSVD